MPIHSKLECIFCTFKSQCKGIVKNADSDYAYNRIENEVVNLIEAREATATGLQGTGVACVLT